MLIPAPSDDLCLAYANTLSWRGSEKPVEKLHALTDLLNWLERVAGLSAGAIHDARSWSRNHESGAGAVFGDAIAIREAVFHAFSALASEQSIRERDFGLIRSALADAPARTQLAHAKGGYGWQVEHLQPTAAHLLAPVLWSAADLVVSAPHRRIRQCANEKCLWLFLDESKSGTRRWCDMSSCGNRAKAQRHYLKSKQG
jgi:predicted RNA-binding Zn ribbon-like protein